MTGFSKITDKILDEARAEAAQKLAQADEECVRITAEYKQKADAIAAASNADAKREAAEIISRARSAEKNIRRNIISKTQSEMISRAFDIARDELCELPDAERLDLLTRLLISALSSELEAEQSREAIYGVDENEGERIYEVMLNAKDKAKIGDELVKNFRRKIVGQNFGDMPSRVILSKETANIEGGLIIRVGSVEINCSVESIVEQLRPKLEAQVSKILFP